jgi:ABC-type multidrug transport system fused ATPase/permease subunit
LLAIRDNEDRAAAVGYNLKRFKLLAFVISGAVTGLAGGLHAMMTGIAPLSNAEYHTSEMILVITVIGGTGNLFASVLGAAFYVLLADWLSTLWPTMAAAARPAADRREHRHAARPVGSGRGAWRRVFRKTPPHRARSSTRSAGRKSMTQPVLIEAIGVTKHYGKFAALGGVDLKILPNTVHSVIGPNGAGKTTLFHMLTGTGTTTGGRILFDGHDVTSEPDYKRVQRGMARSFQVTSLFGSLSVRENLRVAAQGHRTAPGHELLARAGRRPRMRRNGGRGAGACRPGAAGRHAGQRAVARPAAPARSRHGARREAQGHLPGRADLGHGHRRPRRHEAADSQPARRGTPWC